MILRLVYSLFFISIVTGHQRNHHYAPPPKVIVSPNSEFSFNPTVVETQSMDVEYESDNDNQAVPQPVLEEEKQFAEKTICFTPAMVHRMVKVALDYVRQMPSDTNNIIIDKLDQELNRMADPESIEEQNVKTPLYPLDSKTMFQMVDTPKSETRTNFILKYELPSVQEPQCKEALEKLIEIAYNAYLELEKHPKCREYLYRFASHQPEDRPKGHIDFDTDITSIIVSIIKKIDKHKSTPVYNQPDYYHSAEIDIPITDIPISQIHDSNFPEFPEINEVNIPQSHKFSIPQLNIQKINQVKIHEHIIPQSIEIIHNDLPHIRDIYDQQIHETIPEIKPLNPEETVTILTNIVKNNDLPSNRNLFDRFMNIIEENRKNFHPKIHHMLLSLLKTHKQRNIPRFNDIILLLLESEKNKKWPWSEKYTEYILSHLLPDSVGQLDSKIIDIILNLYKKPTNEKQIEYILSLLRPIKEGILDPKVGGLTLDLITLHQNKFLRPEHLDILLKLLKPSRNGPVNNKEIDIVSYLSRWNQMGLDPNHLDTLFTLLQPDVNGNTNQKAVDIVHFLLTQNKYISPKNLDLIFSFLYPENGILDTRRIDVIQFILKHVMSQPKLINILISILHNNVHRLLNSRFLDILLFLDKNRLLSTEILETVLTLLNNEITGNLDDNNVKTFVYQLSPFKQANPTLIGDILTILNQGGLHENIVEWSETRNSNIGIPTHDAPPFNLQTLIEKVENLKGKIKGSHGHEYRTVDNGYQNDNEPKAIIQWLDEQTLLNPDNRASNNELISKLIKVLEMGERELGVVELTYMLKHEKPVIYQPVYYVKYRLPILNFMSNMKSLLLENPKLTTDPMKLIQELIVTSNVTEISPSLQGYPKEELLKLTFTDGDLVQAKILDEQNLNLNEQITYVHGLNTDITPEEILQLNRINEAKYYPSNLLQIRAAPTDQVTVHRGVENIVKYPAVKYQQYQRIHETPLPTQTIIKTTRFNQNVQPYHLNSELRSKN